METRVDNEARLRPWPEELTMKNVASWIWSNATMPIDAWPTVPNPKECSAHAELAKAHAAWEKKLPKEASKFFAWLLKKNETVIQDLTVYCAAVTVDAVVSKRQSTNFNSSDLVHAEELAKTLALDMAKYWAPTAKGFIGRMGKKQMARAMTEAGLPDHKIKHMESFKKDDAASIAATDLRGTGWLPQTLKLKAVK
jgi:ParB family transcriptional regulator, chromosome partitioning protein